MRVLVVDDEPLARARITNLLADEADIAEVKEAENGLIAVRMIGEWKPELVFLDIQMPGLDGFGVIECVGVARMPVTVFVTAFDDHAIHAFEAHALDYLLKPFDGERFRQALARARDFIAMRRQGTLEEKLLSLLGRSESERRPDRFLVRTGARISFVDPAEVGWISAEGNYVGLHVGKRVHLVRGTLGEFEARVDPRRFLRIHRSTIVNIEHVTAAEAIFRGEYVLVLRDGSKLNSSASYRNRIETILLGAPQSVRG